MPGGTARLYDRPRELGFAETGISSKSESLVDEDEYLARLGATRGHTRCCYADSARDLDHDVNLLGLVCPDDVNPRAHQASSCRCATAACDHSRLSERRAG